jgi:hypothetical protein
MSVWINMRQFWRVTTPRRPLPTVLGYSWPADPSVFV